MNQDKFVGWRKSRHSNSSEGCVEVATVTNWSKSSHSSDSAKYVEITAADQTVGVRDSKQHGFGPVLEFSLAAWRTFLGAIKKGEFDV